MTTYNLSSRRKPARALLQLGTLLVGACTVGPNYQRAPAPVPVAYKEAAPESGGQTGWRVARPADIYDRGSWWSVYDDPVLDSLERQIDISNQNLKAAAAAFRQAEAIVAQARAGFFPTASFTETATRQRTSGGRVGATGVSGGNTGSISNFFSLTT
jgi:outer membrane protein TolC